MEPERVISKFHLPANVPSGVKCRMRSHGSQGYTEPKLYLDVLRSPRPRPSRLPRLFSLRTGFPVVRHPLRFQISNDFALGSLQLFQLAVMVFCFVFFFAICCSRRVPVFCFFNKPIFKSNAMVFCFCSFCRRLFVRSR